MTSFPYLIGRNQRNQFRFIDLPKRTFCQIFSESWKCRVNFEKFEKIDDPCS